MDFENLIQWYLQNHRELPWRQTRDPYLIWISEIILQQTRVQQGISYYNNFVDRFPTIRLLAEASEDEVLRYWQGLGYYSRARNLHYSARLILSEHNGEFPRTYKELLSLKGIGDYTAAAISSIAYNEEQPAVDGNVLRVISRLFSIATPVDSIKGKKLIHAVASDLIKGQAPGLFNQAFMELGALVCTPKTPVCRVCPLVQHCSAFARRQVHVLPVKSVKTKVRTRYFNYILIEHSAGNETGIYLKKRVNSDIWQNLYELPLIETETAQLPEDLLEEAVPAIIPAGYSWLIKGVSKEYRHQLSHQLLLAVFYRIEILNSAVPVPALLFVPIQNIKDFALPRLIERYLSEEVKLIS